MNTSNLSLSDKNDHVNIVDEPRKVVISIFCSSTVIFYFILRTIYTVMIIPINMKVAVTKGGISGDGIVGSSAKLIKNMIPIRGIKIIVNGV